MPGKGTTWSFIHNSCLQVATSSYVKVPCADTLRIHTYVLRASLPPGIEYLFPTILPFSRIFKSRKQNLIHSPNTKLFAHVMQESLYTCPPSSDLFFIPFSGAVTWTFNWLCWDSTTIRIHMYIHTYTNSAGMSNTK